MSGPGDQADDAAAEASASDPAAASGTDAGTRVFVLREPADGVPEPLTSPAQLADVVRRMRAATGPVAVDAERASGYRYSQRAYLVQVRREGVGTVLVDPIALPDLTSLGEALAGVEWIVHAASQDLTCLAELGMRPDRLFDTELAGRLLGDERVALGTMVEQHLGIGLEKGHSAADWSTRPLPREWLAYAALDVELLIPLRARLLQALHADGKQGWAEQEFEAVRTAPPPAPRAEPWRRTSGIHRLRSRRQVATVRALWLARDAYAAERDIAPGRVLPDSSIIEAARADPRRAADLAALPVFGGSRQRRQLGRWFGAIEEARALPDEELPLMANAQRGTIPPAARWSDRDPLAAARLAAVRATVAHIAEQRQVLGQNLLPSDYVRSLAWQPPEPTSVAGVARLLGELGARPWQIDLTAAPIAEALASAEADNA